MILSQALLHLQIDMSIMCQESMLYFQFTEFRVRNNFFGALFQDCKECRNATIRG